MKSASRPVSRYGIKELQEQRNQGEGETDKNGNPLKFRRDVESDWTVKNEVPHYGLKEHAAVDVRNGLVLATKLTPASVHDTKYLPYLVLASCHVKKSDREGVCGQRVLWRAGPIVAAFERNRGWYYAERHTRSEADGAGGGEEQADLEEAVYCGAVFWLESPVAGGEAGAVYDDREEHVGQPVPANGVQPVSTVKAAGRDMTPRGEKCPWRGNGH